MPTGTVTVTAPVNRVVYLNGDYVPDFPKKIPNTFLVEYGENIFETRNKDGKVDYRAKVATDSERPDRTVALRRVIPPGTPV